MCKDFALNIDDKRTGCCIMTTHHLTLPFSPGNALPKQHNCHPPPSLLFSFYPIEDKTKGPAFYTLEMMKAESQVVLNTLTQHDFQDAF
jgi:hypothetical protein